MPKTIRGTLKQVMTQAASLKPYTMEEIDEMLLAELTDEKLESFRTLHERTPYKLCRL